MEIQECFACYHDKCKILTVKRCPGSDCGFYKTKEQFQADRQLALQRLRLLERVDQITIIDKYYGGKDVCKLLTDE